MDRMDRILDRLIDDHGRATWPLGITVFLLSVGILTAAIALPVIYFFG